MSEVSEHTSIRRQQRQMMLVAAIVAGVPIACQILALIAMAAAPAGSFPAADRSVTDLRFWPIQIVMLCIALAGNAVVDCVRSVWDTGRASRTTVCYLLWLLLAFFIESLMFSVTLLASQIGWVWLSAMVAIGAGNVMAAYALEMELADAAQDVAKNT